MTHRTTALAALLLALLAGVAGAATTITLEWTNATMNSDGTTADDIAATKMYASAEPIPDRQAQTDGTLSPVSGTLVGTVDHPGALLTISYNPAPGQRKIYFRATHVDTSGNESRLSNEAVADLPDKVAPGAPITLTIKIVVSVQ